jgi:hypothetical protein
MSDWKAILRHGIFALPANAPASSTGPAPLEAATFAALAIAACTGIYAQAVGAISI